MNLDHIPIHMDGHTYTDMILVCMSTLASAACVASQNHCICHRCYSWQIEALGQDVPPEMVGLKAVLMPQKAVTWLSAFFP